MRFAMCPYTFLFKMLIQFPSFWVLGNDLLRPIEYRGICQFQAQSLGGPLCLFCMFWNPATAVTDVQKEATQGLTELSSTVGFLLICRRDGEKKARGDKAELQISRTSWWDRFLGGGDHDYSQTTKVWCSLLDINSQWIQSVAPPPVSILLYLFPLL